MHREDSVLDEIDRLVNDSLDRGDQSDSWHGEQYRAEESCPWCCEGWHFLPITRRMQEMRAGSYAVDEFGQGIVDPEYRYESDDSAILCPGSEFHGPEDKWGTWDKQSRERAKELSGRSRPYNYIPLLSSSLPSGPIRRLRFFGPFNRWTISLNDERVIEEIVSDPSVVGMPGIRRRIPVVRESRLTATFELNEPIRNPTQEWLWQNRTDIVGDFVLNAEGLQVNIRDIVIPFRNFSVFAEDQSASEPDWIELETSYLIEQHPWFMQLWTVSGGVEDVHLRPVSPDIRDIEVYNPPEERQGYEADYVTIDEAYQHNEEDLRNYVQLMQGEAPYTFSPGRIWALPAEEEDDQAQRGQEVLRGGEEDQARQDRPVDAQEQS